MSTPSSEIGSRRLDLAGTRDFAVAGAGPARRAALSALQPGLARRGAGQSATGGSQLEGVALAAVGSIGRGDAGPLSDYDLVLLHSERSLRRKELTALADRIWYPIWDAGRAARPQRPHRQPVPPVAAADLTAAVGLLDITSVAGDEDVVDAARSTVAHDWRANARNRLPQLRRPIVSRHQRQGDLAHVLEPELKEAHGGLRDMTVPAALAAAWLADRPHGAVDAATTSCSTSATPCTSSPAAGRDRLAREDHDAAAALLGYHDADELLTDVSTAARLIAYSLDGTLRRAGQSQRARTLRVGPRRPRMTPLGLRPVPLRRRGGARLRRRSPRPTTGCRSAPAWSPPAPTSAIAPTTLQNLARNCPPIPTPWPPAALRDVFGDLLATGPGLVTVWEGLDQVGVVETVDPGVGGGRSRPQRNAVHRHTVDRHLIETVVRASGLVREVTRPDLLLVAALLHDIGKVPGSRDHSETGRRSPPRRLQRLGVRAADVDCS